MLLRLSVGLAWPRLRLVQRDGATLSLTVKEAGVLALLAAEDRTVSVDEIMERVWGWNGQTHTLATTIYTLRRKVEARPERPTHVLTVRGEGYRFAPLPVSPWPMPLDGTHPLDVVLAGAQLVARRDPEAARLSLEAMGDHGSLHGRRAATHHTMLASMAQRWGELERAQRHIDAGFAAAEETLDRGRLWLVAALVAWRRGEDPHAALSRAQADLDGTPFAASVRFHGHLFNGGQAEQFESCAAEISVVSPLAAAVYLLAAGHLVDGEGRVELCRRALELALQAEAPHEAWLARQGEASALARMGRVEEADAVLAAAEPVPGRHRDVFGRYFEVARAEASGRRPKPTLRREACPFTWDLLAAT